MNQSSGSGFLLSLSAEEPNSIVLQQQITRLSDERKRLLRMASREEDILLKATAQYKSTKFRIEQVDEQIQQIESHLKDAAAPLTKKATPLANVSPRSPEQAMDE